MVVVQTNIQCLTRRYREQAPPTVDLCWLGDLYPCQGLRQVRS